MSNFNKNNYKNILIFSTIPIKGKQQQDKKQRNKGFAKII